jgi:hypothetical protein
MAPSSSSSSSTALNSLAARIRVIEKHKGIQEVSSGAAEDAHITAHIISSASSIHGILDRALGVHHHSLSTAVRGCRDRIPDQLFRRLLRLAASASAVRHVTKFSLDVLAAETSDLFAEHVVTADPLRTQGMDPWASAAAKLPSRPSPVLVAAPAPDATVSERSGSSSEVSVDYPAPSASWAAVAASATCDNRASPAQKFAMFLGSADELADLTARLGIAPWPSASPDTNPASISSTSTDLLGGCCSCGCCSPSWLSSGWKCHGIGGCVGACGGSPALVHRSVAELSRHFEPAPAVVGLSGSAGSAPADNAHINIILNKWCCLVDRQLTATSHVGGWRGFFDFDPDDLAFFEAPIVRGGAWAPLSAPMVGSRVRLTQQVGAISGSPTLFLDCGCRGIITSIDNEGDMNVIFPALGENHYQQWISCDDIQYIESLEVTPGNLSIALP